MDLPTILAIAFGLAMDAFSVSVASGVTGKCTRKITALRMAFSFGAFQAVMPAVGWLAGVSMLHLISEVDHWMAFALLIAVGVKMIYEALRPGFSSGMERLGFGTLMALSIATSIDALAVGISFAVLKVSAVSSMLIIGTVTFFLSFSGAIMGEKVKRFSPGRIEAFGGLVLIAIGVKILMEHLA